MIDRVMRRCTVRVRNQHAIRHVVTSCALATTIGACASLSTQIQPLPAPPSIGITTTRASDEQSELVVSATELALPGPVEEAWLFPDQRTALVRHYPAGKRGGRSWVYAVYDLERRSLKWTAQSNATVQAANESLIILQYQGFAGKLLDAQTGAVLGNAPVGIELLGGDTAIVLNTKRFARLNPRTAGEIWGQPVSGWTGFRWHIRDGQWVYVIADGVRAFRLGDGSGWTIDASTSDHLVGQTMKSAAITGLKRGLLAALTGVQIYGGLEKKVAHNLASRPLPLGDCLYFAARKRAMCLKRETGETVWASELERESGAMRFYDYSADHVALVDEGWRYVTSEIQYHETPTVTLFGKATGERKATFATADKDVARDLARVSDGSVLLTSAHLYLLDDELRERKRIDSVSRGRFERVVDSSGPIIVRTSRGVLALDPQTLAEVWFADAAASTDREVGEKRLDTWFRDTVAGARAGSEKGHMWVVTSTGVSAVSLPNGKIVARVPLLPDDHAAISESGTLLVRRGDRLRIIPLRQRSAP